MSKLVHLYRRKALYYWRRRLPPPLRSWFHKKHLFLSLRTADPIFARRLVVLLDAKLEEIVTAFEQSAMHLTPPQVDGLLRDVVTTHLNKLERLSAAAKSFPEFDPAQAGRDDRRAAWSYRLLHAQGPSAIVRPPDEEHMSADGMTAADIAAVQDHLAMLRINNLVPTRHGILQKLLDANGAPANAMNLATAQDVYFRGIAATLMGRYRIDELKSGDVSQLIGLLGKIGFSPNERGRMNLPTKGTQAAPFCEGVYCNEAGLLPGKTA